MTEKLVYLDGVDLLEFCGANNSKLDTLRRSNPQVHVVVRGEWLKVNGESSAVEEFEAKVTQMLEYYREHNVLPEDVIGAIAAGRRVAQVPSETAIIVHTVDGRPIKPRGLAQEEMMRAVDVDDMVFAIGPAGSGKTYLAIALAVRALKAKQVRRIILSRPAVEAGEKLGFLPGDMKDKIDPYLQPLYDALEDMIPGPKLRELLENKTIEIAPLAFMRGRTLSNAFVILDEAQNTTMQQMKMFLTRMGFNAKFIITGDPSQVDLPTGGANGLMGTCQVLRDVKGISVIHFKQEDIVRHKLVQRIVEAFEREENQHAQDEPKQPRRAHKEKYINNPNK